MSDEAYDWDKAANGEGSGQAAKLEKGEHNVEITRVLFGKKDGTEFRSKAGDPQIMVIFADNGGREAGLMVTLSIKAGFRLAQILSAAGANVQRMTAAKITPMHFAEAEFATKNLIGRQLRIAVDWPAGSQYPDIVPIRAQAAAPEEPTSEPPF